MQVLVIDDQVLFREGLAALLAHQTGIQVVGGGGTVREAVDLAFRLRPDVILMDYRLSDGTGIEAMKQILHAWCDARIVILSVHDDDQTIFDALRAGAQGYLPKNTPVSSLIELLRGVERGEPALPPHITARVLAAFAQQTPARDRQNGDCTELSVREHDVLQALSAGATNRQIAERLYISENTVKNHVRNILSKLHVRNRAEAAALARRLK